MKRLTASPDAARDAFGRISRGSSVLTDRITSGAGEWVRAGRRTDLTGVAATLGCWVRAGMLLGGAWIAYQVLRAAPNLMWAATAVWCWKAYRVKPAAEAAEPAADDAREQPAQAPAVDLQKAALPTREQLVQALHAVAAPHAQTVPLADHLGTSHIRVREALQQAGIPLTDGVRMKGRSSAAGVRREDFPPLPSPAPHSSPPVVAAGQRVATTTTTPGRGPIVERPHPGMLIVRYPEDTAQRTHRVKRP